MISSQRKAKINWHCRRGMLELDLILERFAKRHLDTLTDEQLTAFEHLLSHQDPDIYAWLMDYEKPASTAVPTTTIEFPAKAGIHGHQSLRRGDSLVGVAVKAEKPTHKELLEIVAFIKLHDSA